MTTEPGVHHVTWWSDGRPDMFVVAHADRAHPRWLGLADVVIHPPEPTVSAADRLAADTLSRSTGCAVIAVGVVRRGVLVRFRCGCVRLFRGEGSPRETLRIALLGYRSLCVSTTPLS